MKIGRREAVAVPLGVALVVAAFVVPHLSLGIVTPLIHSTPKQIHDYADTAPIFGWWKAHVGWGTIPAVAIGSRPCCGGPRSRAATVVAGVPRSSPGPPSCGWAFSLAMIDGWQRRVRGAADARHEYLRQVPTITDIPEMLRTFSSRILDFQPHSWITHVSGHPPGALLTFVWLDRIGLSGGAWAGAFCLLVGSSAATAVIVAVRAVSDEPTARLAAPFVAVAPTAIWIAVSADAYFAGVAAWGIALLALAASRTVRWPIPVAAGAGLLLGWAIFLNYGLMLMGLPALAVLIAARRPPGCAGRVGRRGARRGGGGRWCSRWRGSGGSTVIPLCSNAIGRASRRTGRSSTGAGRTWRRSRVRSAWAASPAWARVFDIAGDPSPLRSAPAGAGRDTAILCADLSMLSKAETERIWLPFMVWLTAAPALLPPSTHRWWLAANVIGALAINHFILTNW